MSSNNKRTASDVDEVPKNRPAKTQRKDSNPIQSDDVPRTLLDLDDYSLLEMLSHLSEIDLCATQATCTRLKRLSADCFRSKYKNECFKFKPSDECYILFRCFGAHMRDAKVDFLDFTHDKSEVQRIWSFLFEKCCILTRLTILNAEFSKFSRARASALCHNLQCLIIVSGGTKLNCYDLRRFILACEKLEMVAVGSYIPNCISSTLFKHHYPNLKRMVYHNAIFNYEFEREIKQKDIQEFIEKNRQIDGIAFEFQNTEINSKILLNISNNLVNIEVIWIRLSNFDASFVDDLVSLHTLPKLKSLRINCGEYAIGAAINTLATRNQLETLGLSETILDDELVDALRKLTKLKSLQLLNIKGIHRNAVRSLSETQQNLEQLSFIPYNSMDFENVLFFIEFNPKLQCLQYSSERWENSYHFKEDEFVGIVNARKRSGAMNCLNVKLCSILFSEAMKSITRKTLKQNILHVQLKQE